MKKLYVCPYCKSEHSGIAVSWEDYTEENGGQLSPIFECTECGHWFSADEGFWGYEGQPDNNPKDDIPPLPPIQIDIDRW